MAVMRHRGKWELQDRFASVWQYLPVSVPAGASGLRAELEYDRAAPTLAPAPALRRLPPATGRAGPPSRPILTAAAPPVRAPAPPSGRPFPAAGGAPPAGRSRSRR